MPKRTDALPDDLARATENGARRRRQTLGRRIALGAAALFAGVLVLITGIQARRDGGHATDGQSGTTVRQVVEKAGTGRRPGYKPVVPSSCPRPRTRRRAALPGLADQPDSGDLGDTRPRQPIRRRPRRTRRRRRPAGRPARRPTRAPRMPRGTDATHTQCRGRPRPPRTPRPAPRAALVLGGRVYLGLAGSRAQLVRRRTVARTDGSAAQRRLAPRRWRASAKAAPREAVGPLLRQRPGFRQR